MVGTIGDLQPHHLRFGDKFPAAEQVRDDDILVEEVLRLPHFQGAARLDAHILFLVLRRSSPAGNIQYQRICVHARLQCDGFAVGVRRRDARNVERAFAQLFVEGERQRIAADGNALGDQLRRVSPGTVRPERDVEVGRRDRHARAVRRRRGDRHDAKCGKFAQPGSLERRSIDAGDERTGGVKDIVILRTRHGIPGDGLVREIHRKGRGVHIRRAVREEDAVDIEILVSRTAAQKEGELQVVHHAFQVAVGSIVVARVVLEPFFIRDGRLFEFDLVGTFQRDQLRYGNGEAEPTPRHDADVVRHDRIPAGESVFLHRDDIREIALGNGVARDLDIRAERLGIGNKHPHDEVSVLVRFQVDGLAELEAEIGISARVELRMHLYDAVCAFKGIEVFGVIVAVGGVFGVHLAVENAVEVIFAVIGRDHVSLHVICQPFPVLAAPFDRLGRGIAARVRGRDRVGEGAGAVRLHDVAHLIVIVFFAVIGAVVADEGQLFGDAARRIIGDLILGEGSAHVGIPRIQGHGTGIGRSKSDTRRDRIHDHEGDLQLHVLVSVADGVFPHVQVKNRIVGLCDFLSVLIENGIRQIQRNVLSVLVIGDAVRQFYDAVGKLEGSPVFKRLADADPLRLGLLFRTSYKEKHRRTQCENTHQDELFCR